MRARSGGEIAMHEIFEDVFAKNPQLLDQVTGDQTERGVRDTRGSPEVRFSAKGKNNTNLSCFVNRVRLAMFAKTRINTGFI